MFPWHSAATLIPAWLSKNEAYQALATGSGIGEATVFRGIREGLAVLAERATAPDPLGVIDNPADRD